MRRGPGGSVVGGAASVESAVPECKSMAQARTDPRAGRPCAVEEGVWVEADIEGISVPPRWAGPRWNPGRMALDSM